MHSAKQIAGRIDLGVQSIRPGESLQYSVENCGTTSILLGESYDLERRSGNQWVGVHLPWGFRLVGYLLCPGDRRLMSARIPDDTTTGRYRIRKALRAAPEADGAAQGFAPVEATAEFDVSA